MMEKRVVGLDWLRGACALSILFYHFFMPADISSALCRLGIYGVSIFFILSGLSIAMAYNSFIINADTSARFFIRRVFRILPLYVVVCCLALLFKLGKGVPVNWNTFLMNITLLFGFVKPDHYFAVGAWSIGNEMVYYAFAPLFIYLYNKKKLWGNLLFLATAGIGIYFAFFVLDRSFDARQYWSNYVNPFNNLFLFAAGIALYYNTAKMKLTNWNAVTTILISSGILLFMPLSGKQIVIMTGYERILFSVLSIIIVFGFYKLNIEKINFTGKIFEQFGIATYGVYLLHPIMLNYTGYFCHSVCIKSSFLYYTLAFTATISAALISYYYMEKPIIRLGKKLTKETMRSTFLNFKNRRFYNVR